jgi:hypothetical protein
MESPDNSPIIGTIRGELCNVCVWVLVVVVVPAIVPLLVLLEANFAMFAFANTVVESPSGSRIIGIFRGELCNFCRDVAETSARHCKSQKQ